MTATVTDLAVRSLAGVMDPAGALVNAAHSAAQLKAAEGSKVAKAVNIGMSMLVLGDGLADLGDVVATAGDVPKST